ncbi:spermatogenesis-associated protein 31E1-like [Phyllostomus discolor]|uniref:Spermatogenesis-associated protein 31E1-like n=1 Tax=Phyllostomus discolor TaxID=89673 RepID=A0A6J2N439_9CHIR|nr:spermatogenesis-associated protein 31E1-like [Phyllostomus discolor]
MMEKPLFSLKSILATWQSSSPSLVIDIIFAISCGLLLFLLLLTCLESDPPLPPPRKHGNIRKHSVELRWRSRKKSGALKACRDCLQEIEEARCLISLLQSHLGKFSDNQHSCQNPPGELCKAAPTGVHQPYCVPVENAAPAMSTSPSLLTVCTLPLASPLSAEHQDQPDLMKIPLSTIVKSSPPGNSFLASSIPAISGLGCSSYPMKFLSWWWVTTKALFFPTSSQHESQQEHLSHHPPEALFWGDPTDKQIETGSLSFINPDIQKLLEIVITKKAELKVWKERERDVSLSKQKGLDNHLKSFGNIWTSLGAKQDSATPQPFWSMKDIKEQVPSPQQFSHHQLWEDHRQQKCSQLFWGLPSLHSESLVATAWVARSSYPQPLSFLFNGMCNHCPARIQPTTSSGLSQAVLLSLSGAQPQPLTGNLPQSQTPPLAQIQSQTHLIPSHSIQPPSSLIQMSTSGVSCPTAQNKEQYFIPPDIQYLELKRERALLSLTKRSQEVFSQPTPNFPQNSRASHGHRRVPIPHKDFIGKSLQKQYLQKRLTTKKQQGGLHFRVQVSLEMMQAQSQFPGMCHAQDKKGPFQDSHKMESRYHRRSHRKDQRGKDFRRDLWQCMRRIPEVLSRDSNTIIVKVLKVNSKRKSEGNLKPQKSGVGICLYTGPEKKHIENILKAHLDRKLEQIIKGLIPASVGRSWLAANHVFLKFHTHMETRNQVSLKGQEYYLNTSCELSFLSPLTQQVLEAHMIRFHERHRWGRPHQAFEPTNLKLHETQYLPLPRACSPTSSVYVFGVHLEDKYTKVLGKPPPPFLGEKVITKKSLLTPLGPLSTTSPVSEEIQKTLEEMPSGDGHGLSETPLKSQEGRPPPHSLTLSLMGKIWQIGTVTGIEKRSLIPNPSSAVARNEPREGRRAIVEMNLGSQSSKAEEAREALEAEETPAWKVTVGPSVLANSQTINMGMRRSESLVPDKSSSLPTKSVAQDLQEPSLKKNIANKFELQGKVESENQLQALAASLLPQDCHTDVIFQDNTSGMCLQDSATNVLLQDLHNDVLLAADIMASHGSLRENTSGDMLVAQVPYDLILSEQSSQGQQEPGIPKLKDPFLSQSKMFLPIDGRENDRRPNQREQNEGLEEPRNSQASRMNNPPQVRGMGDTLGSKYLQLLPEKTQVFLENHFRKRHSPQYLNPNKKGKGSEEPLRKGQPVITIAQNQEPVKSRPVLDNAPVEAQVIVRAVGQILVEKLGLHQGLHAKELNQHKQQLQAPVGECSCYLKVLSSSKQRRVRKDGYGLQSPSYPQGPQLL